MHAVAPEALDPDPLVLQYMPVEPVIVPDFHDPSVLKEGAKALHYGGPIISLIQNIHPQLVLANTVRRTQTEVRVIPAEDAEAHEPPVAHRAFAQNIDFCDLGVTSEDSPAFAVQMLEHRGHAPGLRRGFYNKNISRGGCPLGGRPGLQGHLLRGRRTIGARGTPFPRNFGFNSAGNLRWGARRGLRGQLRGRNTTLEGQCLTR